MTGTAKIARVLDFESTGLPDNPDATLCEAGFVDLDLTDQTFPLGRTWSTLINPGCPIPPETMAVHHITDSDVADAPTIRQALDAIDAGMGAADVYVAHHADFEKHFYGRDVLWIDTWKCALRAWPEAPAHSNQVLRYWLGLDLDLARATPPHRALPDAYVTAHILRKLLQLRPVDRLVQISTEPGFLTKVHLGKHKGKTFKEVAAADPGYLSWIVEKSDMGPDEKFSAAHWLKKAAA